MSNIYREFEKINDKYIATNNFFISCDNNLEDCEFEKIDINSLCKKNDIKFIPCSNNNDLYISINNTCKEEYIDLILIKNVSFSIDELQINKNDLLKKFINNDSYKDEKIIEDIYYNKNFSKKIKLQIPVKNNSYKNISKKYLFKINMFELNQSFYKRECLKI